MVIGRATLTFSEIDHLLGSPSGNAAQLIEQHGVPVFQLDAGAPKLVGWRSVAQLIGERFADQPDELERRLADLQTIRGASSLARTSRAPTGGSMRVEKLADAATMIDLLCRAAGEGQGGERWLKARLFDAWAAVNAPEITSADIRKRLGTWTAALRAAGLPAPDTTSRLEAREQRLEQGMADVRRAASDTGECPLTAPTYRRWSAANGADPDKVLESLLDGRWSSVLLRAGLPTKRLKWRGSPEQMLERLGQAALDLGVTRLKQRAYTSWLESHDGPSVTQIRDRFGQWASAVIAAELEPAWDRKQLPMLLPIEAETGAE